jgi:hypothetical protein
VRSERTGRGKVSEPKITYVQNDEGDWCGLYVDGSLEYEGHSMPASFLMDILERTILPDTTFVKHYDYHMNDDHLPQREHDLRTD